MKVNSGSIHGLNAELIHKLFHQKHFMCVIKLYRLSFVWCHVLGGWTSSYLSLMSFLLPADLQRHVVIYRVSGKSISNLFLPLNILKACIPQNGDMIMFFCDSSQNKCLAFKCADILCLRALYCHNNEVETCDITLNIYG